MGGAPIEEKNKIIFFAQRRHKHGTNRGSNVAREHGVAILIIRHRHLCGIIQLLINHGNMHPSRLRNGLHIMSIPRTMTN